MPTSNPPIPKEIGRYVIERVLGVGAMGRVLLARDPVLDRLVAIKHLRSDLHLSSEARRGLLTRMRHEARAAARVAHPHLVVLHDMGEDPELGLYLVFEYIEGPNLKAKIAEQSLTPQEVGELAVELGDALTTAHNADIVHRDVKPENIILSPYGSKIADFGIARVPDSTLTHAGGLMGTPAYSAPETFRSGTFSAASDQFSLAATLYEALYGTRAFPGDDAVAVATRVTNESPRRLAESKKFSKDVDDVLFKAMAKNPAERFESCLAFGNALWRALHSKFFDEATSKIERRRVKLTPVYDNRRPFRTAFLLLLLLNFTLLVLMRLGVLKVTSPDIGPFSAIASSSVSVNTSTTPLKTKTTSRSRSKTESGAPSSTSDAPYP